ncbi:MAG: rod shape-determining protein MreC [Thermodesulfovibrio sp.]|nr:rod shape-determining protein MreC [Thermodesulfovibrio sp.]MCX7724453.1 rod shape-determining protein MreC [Thermodesulfovibrio sp.]MDW7972174.1 rod shape-determining protein MreC [Thermodesulfovibrio sp.]
MTKRANLFIIVGICLIGFLLISYQSKGFLNFNKLDISIVISPFQYMKNFFYETLKLREENRHLKEQLYQMLLQQKSYHELIEENKRLKSLLNLKEKRKEVVSIAKVIRVGSNKFFKTFWIDKGLEQGVKVGMPVITLNGLAGKIIFTSANFSEVLSLTDPNFSVSVRVERTRVEGVVSGTGTNICVLKYIPLEEDVAVGDILITSGTDGIFPEGIKVGVVKKIERKKGFFQHIEVLPYQSETKIEEVAIVKNLI